MSVSPTTTLPSTRAPGMVSCIRLRQRTKVDFPQPDGPMMAVTWLGSIDILMPCSASVAPNQAFRSRTLMPTPISGSSSIHTAAGHDTHGGHSTDNENDKD